MALKQKYNHQADAIASYDFVDISSGTGYINYYLGTTVDVNVISNLTFYSNTVFTQSSRIAADTYTKMLDLDFDVLINKPTVFKGQGIVNVPIAVYHDDSAVWGYVIIKMRKWDGTTETEIIENTSSVVSATNTIAYLMTATDLQVPSTQFKKGETLRFTIEGWAKATTPAAGVAPYMRIGHDPKARATGWDATVPSLLNAQLPVRIDL